MSAEELPRGANPPAPHNRSRSVWIPPGEWTHAFTPNLTVVGPKAIAVANVSLDEMPLYHRRGAVMVTVGRAFTVSVI